MIIKALQQNWRIETNRDRERKIERHKDRFLNEWQKRSFIRGTLRKKVGNLRLLMRRFHSFSTVNTSISDRLTLDTLGQDLGVGSPLKTKMEEFCIEIQIKCRHNDIQARCGVFTNDLPRICPVLVLVLSARNIKREEGWIENKWIVGGGCSLNTVESSNILSPLTDHATEEIRTFVKTFQ